MPPQRLGSGRHPVPGQVHDPAARHVRLKVQFPDADAADLGRPGQRPLQPRPVGFAGPLRHSSISEYRAPSGTVTRLSSRAA